MKEEYKEKQERVIDIALQRINAKPAMQVNGIDVMNLLLIRLETRSKEQSRILLELAKANGIDMELSPDPLPQEHPKVKLPIVQRIRYKIFR